MIHSVALRLSLFYLAIIMALSIGFSLVIYRVSADELGKVVQPPKDIVTMVDEPWRSNFVAARLAQSEMSRNNLRGNLIFLNIGTLLLGAIGSYALARRTLQPIEEAFEAQGRFTADASHELRTPLTAMQTSIEVGLRNPNLTLKNSKELLQGTLEEVGKLSRLSNGLLKLTRNAQDMPKKPVSLPDIAKETILQLELAASQKKITLTNTVPKLTVWGDDISLKEVLVILVDNAIKYSGAHTTVTISGRQQGKLAFIMVQDQGQGIKASDTVHIFDRFYRADSSRSRDRSEGYGLGLSIAKKIAEAHGGNIEVKSTPGEGSTFTVKLPLA